MKDKTIGIYIHIPFCIKKCPYCSFNSIEAAEIPEDAYVNALLKELSFSIRERPELSERVLETIYIGGGTPSLISPEGIGRAMRGIKKMFRLSQAKPIPSPGGRGLRGGGAKEQLEVTLEVNPGTVTFEKLRLFKDAGINRLSIGVQSFNEKRLRSLGRIHTVRDALNCYANARKAGFKNIGIDLISCIPNQTISEWKSELDMAISLRPEHISAYTLTLESGTPFYRQNKDGLLLLPDEEAQAEMFELTMDKLVSAGYNHYEISNYALQGFESGHNSRYWDSRDYIGLGAGAHSYISSPERGEWSDRGDWGVRWWNKSLPDDYVTSVNNNGQAISDMEILTEEEAITEGIFLGMRKIKGIFYDQFSERFNFSLKKSRARSINQLTADGFIIETDNRLCLTRKGLLVADTVITALI